MTISNRVLKSMFLALACLHTFGQVSDKNRSVAKTSAAFSQKFGLFPMQFEKNEGQTDARVKFLARGGGYGLFLTSDEVVLKLHPSIGNSAPNSHRALPTASSTSKNSEIVRLRLLGSEVPRSIDGLDELPGRSNYFLGDNSHNWRTNVPNYSRVCYTDIYRNVNLFFYGNQGQLEYDFVVSPGGDGCCPEVNFPPNAGCGLHTIPSSS